MNLSDLKGLNDLLESLKKQPVYLTLTLLSSVFIIFSIVYDRYIFFGVSLLIYAISGIFWRFFVKDLQALFPDKNTQIILLFHVGNLDLLVTLIYCLTRIGVNTIFV